MLETLAFIDSPAGPAGLGLRILLLVMLAVVTVTDLERRIIPNRVLAAPSLGCLGLVAIGQPASLPERFAAAFSAGGLLLLIAVARPDAMGLGDVKLTAAIGLFLGVEVFPALLVALLAGSAIGAGLMLRDGVWARSRTIPLGPFLALGAVVAMLAGEAIIEAYRGSVWG